MDPAPSLGAELWLPLHLESSSVVTDRSNGSPGGGAGRRRPRRDAAAHEDEPSKLVSTSGTGGSQDLLKESKIPSVSVSMIHADPEAKRLKKMTSSDNLSLRTETQTDSGNARKAVDKNPTPPAPPKQDYIHVRARRGQATDSHSLAERARREKISERMKMLQDLVPGCNKVIGKASVLDEIINYIQALQRQVEFLSMKLEAVNAHVNNGCFPSKDVAAQPYHMGPGLTFEPQTLREYAQGSTPEWLHMQIGNASERVT